MRPPIFVRTLTEEERRALGKGVRSSHAFVLRRCPMRLASAQGERAPRIAQDLGIDDRTVLDALHACNAKGLACLQKGSSCAECTRFVFVPEQADRLRALLHRSPRDFGKPTSVWTLALAADVSVVEGIMSTQVSGETSRHALLRLGIGWERAKHWITSPDPAIPHMREKKGSGTA